MPAVTEYLLTGGSVSAQPHPTIEAAREAATVPGQYSITRRTTTTTVVEDSKPIQVFEVYDPAALIARWKGAGVVDLVWPASWPVVAVGRNGQDSRGAGPWEGTVTQLPFRLILPSTDYEFHVRMGSGEIVKTTLSTPAVAPNPSPSAPPPPAPPPPPPAPVVANYRPPLKGMVGGSVLDASDSITAHLGTVQGFQAGKYMTGKAMNKISATSGIKRTDGSTLFNRVISPYTNRRAFLMTLRSIDAPKDSSGKATAFRTQFQHADGFAGVTVESPKFGQRWRALCMHWGDDLLTWKGPADVLVDQNHASKVVEDSWGGVSPPTALHLSRIDGKVGLKAHYIAVNSDHPRGDTEDRPEVSRWVTILDEIDPGTPCKIVQSFNLIHGGIDQPSTGWWKLRVKHGSIDRSFTIADNEPTMYPYLPGKEFENDGVTIKPTHSMFETTSLYTWPTISLSPPWQISQYVERAISAMHIDGMTEDGWFALLDKPTN